VKGKSVRGFGWYMSEDGMALSLGYPEWQIALHMRVSLIEIAGMRGSDLRCKECPRRWAICSDGV
jgi:hypothetical protein